MTGGRQLKARIKAIGDTSQLLRGIQLETVAEAKRLVPRKTGFLGSHIVLGSVTDTLAIVYVNAPYAAAVEFGSKPHVIVPKQASVLAWPSAAGSRRLSGRARKGTQRGDMTFAMKVNHPGNRASRSSCRRPRRRSTRLAWTPSSRSGTRRDERLRGLGQRDRWLIGYWKFGEPVSTGTEAIGSGIVNIPDFSDDFERPNGAVGISTSRHAWVTSGTTIAAISSGRLENPARRINPTTGSTSVRCRPACQRYSP